MPWQRLLVVIKIVDIHGVPVLEPKRHPPVARNGYRMVTPLAALEGMQTKARDIHALRPGASIEGGEDAQEFRGAPLGNSRRSALLIELPQAAMPECLDHWQKVWCLSTIVNHKKRSAEATSWTAAFGLRSPAPQTNRRSSVPPVREAARLGQWGGTVGIGPAPRPSRAHWPGVTPSPSWGWSCRWSAALPPVVTDHPSSQPTRSSTPCRTSRRVGGAIAVHEKQLVGNRPWFFPRLQSRLSAGAPASKYQ